MSDLSTLCSEMEISLTSKLKGYLTDPDGWQHFAWECTLGYQGRTLTTTYRTGVGHVKTPPHAANTPQWATSRTIHATEAREAWFRNPKAPTAPSVADVVSSLTLDGMSAQASFEEWCNDLGCDGDSRKAYSTYQACQEILCTLVALFGVDLHKLVGVEH